MPAARRILKDFVRRVRPVRKPAYLMLEFAAGECAQVDWGSYGSITVGSTHPRSYDRRQDIRNPDHIQELLLYRHRAREQTCLQAFLSLGPQADLYVRRLQEKRLNTPHHIQKIVALSQIHGMDKVARALDDALTFEAFGCEYIANLLEQRERQFGAPSPLHLTRGQDLLDLDLPAADLNLYELKPSPTSL